MENYSLLMGAAVMKMAVEMAAVSMDKPFGHFPLELQALAPPPFSVRRRSFKLGARRAHAAPLLDFAVRRSSAATPSCPPHSRFLASFSASPSTEHAGDRRPASPPANTSLSDRAAQAHFERGFGLPASPFFRSFLDFYKLQPHHLPGNAIFYLSCYATFMEAYIGIRPTRETFARFFALRINSVQGKDIPKPKPPVQCGSCIVGSRQGSPFFKFSGLESCRLWQGTFFYVKNTGRADLIDLPPFEAGPPSRTNWSYNPKSDHAETSRVVRFLTSLKKETKICSDDIIRTFISRRVLPLKRRAHRMSEMYGPGDPTKITGRQGPPLIEAERRGPCQPRALDSFDPDPYVFWKDLKMGKTPAARLGRSPPKPTGSADDLVTLEKQPASDAGGSQAPPSKRFRTEPLGEKQVGMRRYGRKAMPTSSGPALKLGPRPSGSEGSARTSTPPPRSSPASPGAGNISASLSGGTTNSGRAAPSPSDHRTEEDLSFLPEHQDTGASNIGAGEEEAAGRAEPAPPVLEKTTSAPESSAPEGSNTGDAPSAPPSPRTILMPPPEAPRAQPSKAAPGAPPAKTSGASSTAPPPKPSKLIKGKATASSAPSGGQQPLVLHVSKAAKSASMKATGLLGRITEFQRQGRDLGHLLPYAQKWNAADITPATRGMGKDRLPAPDPVGDRCSEEHFMRLRAAVKELDSAWYDSTNNLTGRRTSSSGSTRRRVDALKTSHRELKTQLIQLGLDHAKAFEAAAADAAAKMEEALEDASNANVVLLAELEEVAKGRKAAEDRAARLEEEHKECDQLILQTDALAYRLFPDSQRYAIKKVDAQRKDKGQADLAVPWTPMDHLVALNARVSHMRCIDRNLSDIPDVATQLYRTLWPGEEVPDTFSLISDRLKGAGRRIREWQCSAARAGADSALRVACSWYPELDLDALTGVREDAETDLDPILSAKRQDRAYRIAEYADMRTFIPPPPGVKDYLDEEEDEAEEELLGDAGAGDAPPEAPAA
ncbi:hypothetical protein QYE76_035254 [Lolium multiflorum]|uniref:Transposase (putative) gypsy type domain-containing protein n=1 Tax=Lolium multiflorum TaxID=4521 RepID=A0AAD8QZC4_LOLMU|nr:hypothetical protein QYE76_035254 [Lolium multiflorum]